MPAKVSPNGSFRLDRTFGGLRITRASGVKGDWANKKVRREYEYRDGLLTKLWERGQVDVLEAFSKGELTIEDIVNADRLGKLGGLASDLATLKPLWSTWEAIIPTLKTDRGRPISEGTRLNYEGSMKRLRAMKLPALGDAALIADLERVDWAKSYEAWDQSAAAWNHLGRALSRFLTVVLGDKFHPLRRKVVKSFPRMDEHPRTPDLTVRDLKRIIDMVPERYRSPFVVLALTGMRLGELMRLTPDDLHPSTGSIEIKGRHFGKDGEVRRGPKTKHSVRKVYVAPQHWHHVEASVPMPISHWYLRDLWRSAIDRAFPEEDRDLRIHDLRHFTAQELSDAGVPLTDIQAGHGHASLDQTADYARRSARKRNADVMGGVMDAFSHPSERERHGEV
jgi:integrase